MLVVLLQGLYILKLKLGQSGQSIAETLVDEVRSEAHDLSGIFSRKDPKSGVDSESAVPRKLGNSDVVKTVSIPSPIVTVTGLPKSDSQKVLRVPGVDNAEEKQEAATQQRIIAQEMMEKTLNRVVEDDDDTASLKQKVELDLKREEGGDAEGEEDKESETAQEKEEEAVQVEEWPPLRGPAEGLTCTQWLEEADVFHYSRNFSAKPIRVNENSVRSWMQNPALSQSNASSTASVNCCDVHSLLPSRHCTHVFSLLISGILRTQQHSLFQLFCLLPQQ